LDESLLIGSGVALLLLRTLLGVADSNLVLISRSKIRAQAEDGHRGAERLDHMLDDRHRLHASLSIARTTMSVLLGAITVWVAADHMPNNRSGQFCALALVIGGTLFFEMAARRLAWRSPEALAVTLVGFYSFIHLLASPFVGAFSGLAGGVTHVVGPRIGSDADVTGEDIRLMVDAGRDLEEREKEMIHSIFELGETLAREIMVPRVDVVAVELRTPLDRVLDKCLEHGLSRLPVFDQTVDNVVGLVFSKDLLRFMKEGRMEVPLPDMMRVAYFVPGSKKVDELLREMQREKVSMAIVVDEYGGTDGLITMEDLIEEIVGEITDEYDKDVPTVEVIEDGSVSVAAKTIIEDVNEMLGIDIPPDEYETIGGYVYGLLGHVPAEGETTTVDGLVLTVESVQRQRINKVRVRRENGEPFEMSARATAEAAPARAV